jgi:hypothetical protein
MEGKTGLLCSLLASDWCISKELQIISDVRSHMENTTLERDRGINRVLYTQLRSTKTELLK